MIDFTIETEIERPVSEVFAYVTDPSKLATWQTNTVSAVPEDDGPVGVGTRLREVHRGPAGKEMSSLVEVSELEPDRRFSLRMIEGPVPIDATIDFCKDGGATRMLFNVRGRLKGVSRIAQPLLRLAFRRQFAQHCSNLKRVLEGGGAQASSSRAMSA
jgi:uncharacterized protein YndB with AHSA1/START domain